MSKKQNKMYRALNYFEHFLIFISAVSGFNFCICFNSWCSCRQSEFWGGNKNLYNHCRNYQGYINYQVNMKKYGKIVLLAKSKLNIIEVFISKALTDLYINDKLFVSVNNVLREYNKINNVLREYNKMKEDIKNPENAEDYAT